MNEEKYKLTWHTYSDHLREMLHMMMKSNELTDVTLVCDDKKQFKAHKIVLSACSSVFQSIINDSPHNSVIYLRGIQHQEMESILQFMYLGEATFYQERMNELLSVANNLEIKEISKDLHVDEEQQEENERLCSTEDKKAKADLLLCAPQTSDEDRYTTYLGIRQFIGDSQIQKNTERIFYCNQCQSQFTDNNSLKRHVKSTHEGMRYPCNQCEYKATQQGHLNTHIQSKHDGVKYACNQCDYKATQQSHLKSHIQSKHEGVKFPCNQCEYQFSYNSDLKKHQRLKHHNYN